MRRLLPAEPALVYPLRTLRNLGLPNPAKFLLVKLALADGIYRAAVEVDHLNTHAGAAFAFSSQIEYGLVSWKRRKLQLIPDPIDSPELLRSVDVDSIIARRGCTPKMFPAERRASRSNPLRVST